MSKPHPEIESHLAYSDKLSGLVAGHQQESAQLLNHIEELRADVGMLMDENEALREAIKDKNAQIAELKARIAELEKRPNIGQYVAVQNVQRQEVGNQAVGYPQHKITRTRGKNKYINLTNQLDIWENTTASL